MAQESRSFTQKFVLAFASAERAAAIEADSRAWMVECGACGAERSIWAMGGIRSGAAGSPRRRMRCPACGEVSWHRIHWAGEEAAKADPAAVWPLVLAIVAGGLLVSAVVATLVLKLTGAL